MTDQGLMGVDWEERIDFGRLRRERLQKAKDALARSDVDVLFVFRTEDCRYLTSFRSHLHPAASLGMAVSVLAKGGEPYAGEPGVGGFWLENNLVVTANGPDVYTPYPYDGRLVTKVHPLDTTTGRTR